MNKLEIFKDILKENKIFFKEIKILLEKHMN